MSFLTICWLVLLSSSFLCEGREILVGGKSNTWKVSESTEETLNHWSEKTRFKIGDTLLWRYNAENDSVMQVSEKDYKKCDRSEPIKGYKDGHTKIKLERSGPFYFISGEEGYCQRGEKLLVVVLSPNHNISSNVVVAPPLIAPVMNKGSINGRAWGLVAKACLVLLITLTLLV
ncbi:unnamed protein product [Cochlearia groenlandica]